MAANKIGFMKIREIIQYKLNGISNRKCASMLGISRNTVNEYVKVLGSLKKDYKQLLNLSEEELALLFPPKDSIDQLRYEGLSSQFEHFFKELKKTGCTRQTLWEDYCSKVDSPYGYTQFNAHYNAWLKVKCGSGKLTHLAGDKVLIDYTGKKLHYVDRNSGELIEVEVFIGILPCSHYTFVKASPSQKKEDFIDCMNACLMYYEGTPKAIVPDNLKAAVTKASKYAPIKNKTFRDFALHYGSVLNPTRPRAPQDKALVERTVTLVYQRIFYPLSKMIFHSLEALNGQLAILLENYNTNYQLTHLKLSRRQLFVDIEQKELQPLPSKPYILKHFKRLTVQKMGYIYLSDYSNYYSAPYKLIGKKVEVRYNHQDVEIYYNRQRVAAHITSRTRGHYTTISDHLSSTHKFYSKWSPDFFYSWGMKIGHPTANYIQELIAKGKYPETAYKQCLGIIHLTKQYSPDRVNSACQRANCSGRYSYHLIKRILESGIDLLEQQVIGENTIPPHDNIRGPEFYQ